MHNRYIFPIILVFSSLLQAAAVDEQAELNHIINAQADAKDKVFAGFQYLNERPANATTLAQNSYRFVHALKEALQSNVITKEDLQKYKNLFKPAMAPLAGLMRSGSWSPRVEQLYADLESKHATVQEAIQERIPQEMQKEIEQAVEQIKVLDDVAIAKIQAASGTIKDMAIELAPKDKEELRNAVQTMLQAAIKSIGLSAMQTKALLGALVINDKGAMRAYLVGLDKDTKIALLEAANFLNVPLLLMMSQQSLEGMATEQDIENLPSELAVPLMRDAIYKALVAYVGLQWSVKELAGYPAGGVFSVAFSPDGTKLASGSYDKTVRIWDVKTGAQIGEPLTGHTNAVWSVAFSPDGTKLASSSFDRTVRIWDVKTGAQIGAPLTGRTSVVKSVAWSPDGTKLASGSDDNMVRIWDIDTGEQIGAPLRGHSDEVTSVAWSPDGTKLASGSDDKTVRIWSAKDGQQIGAPLVGHAGIVFSVAFSPHGTKLASGSFDKTVRIWNTQTGDQIGEPLVTGHTGVVSSVAWSPDGTKLVSASSDLRVWNAQTGDQIGEPLMGYTETVYSVAFSPDGTKLASGSTGHKTVRIWQNYYQALVDQCTLNELLVLYQAVSSWQAKDPYFIEAEQLEQLKKRYKDSVIAPLINDPRLFAVRSE